MPAPSISKEIILEGTQPIGYSGLEIEVLETLSTIMNFESEVYDVSSYDKWGIKQINGSFSGLIGEIVSGRADIALGNLYYTPYHFNLMDLTIPYTTQCLTFLTPESLSDNAWQTLLLPFRPYLWLGVVISFVSGALVFLAFAKFHRVIEERSMIEMKKHQNNNFAVKKDWNKIKNENVIGLYQFEEPTNSFLYTYSMLLLVSLPKLPAGWSLRIFTGWWWIYCILVVVAYRASMTSILANPVPRVTIDTLEQLAESDIATGGWGEEIKRFFQTSLDAAGKKIGSKFEVIYDTDEALERVAKGEFAYYENVHFLRHASIHRQIIAMEDRVRRFGESQNETNENTERNLHIMKDCVINMPISLGLQKNSALKPRVDRFLRMIIEAGLVKKWLNDAMAEVLIADLDSGQPPSKALINLKKLFGAFVALGVGYGISILALLAEIINWQVRVVRNPYYDKYSNKVLKVSKQNP
ncbi:UNVERIFIED_CONTAM: hypothetical protein PYX00_005184 [Menopon gallinae]